MKNYFLILIILVFGTVVFAQTPQSFRYQAVARNNSGNVLANQLVSFRISIVSGSVSGTTVYTETHTGLNTNAFGLVELEIGKGTPVTGTFSAINWGGNSYFVKIEMDPNGGASYQWMGTSQLLNVPYALHATTAENGITNSQANAIITNSAKNSYPSDDAAKLAGIAIGAEVNVNANWNATTGDAQILNKPTTIAGYGITDAATTSALTTGLAAKVDIEAGKGLSTNDYTKAEKNKLAGIATGAEVNVNANWNATTGDAQILNKPTTIAGYGITDAATTSALTTGLAAKVDKVEGKGLSTNDYTTAEKKKLAEIAPGAELNIQADWNQTTTTADDYIKNKPTIPTLTIGQSYQGGIIFWLDATGQHGLIAATTDQSTGILWYNGTYRYTGTTGDGLYAGAMNTAMAVTTQISDNQTGNFAAKVCADYSVTVGSDTYGDWYLPSKYELNLLYTQKTAVGGFASAYYWSSTEFSNNYTWTQTFGNGFRDYYNKSNTFRVRAVRAF